MPTEGTPDDIGAVTTAPSRAQRGRVVVLDGLFESASGLAAPILLATFSLSLPPGTEIEPAPPGEQDAQAIAINAPASASVTPVVARQPIDLVMTFPLSVQEWPPPLMTEPVRPSRRFPI